MVTYISKFKSLTLIVKPRRVEKNAGGNNIIPGKSIDFRNGRFSTNLKADQNFIEKHARFGLSVFREKSKEEVENELIAKAAEIKAARNNNAKAAEAVIKVVKEDKEASDPISIPLTEDEKIANAKPNA